MSSSREPSAAAQLALAASFLVGGYFLAVDAGEYLRNFTAAVYGRFWPVRNLMFLHITAGGLRAARRRQWHRHAAWMLRSYMAMMVFAWFRLAWESPVLEEMSLRARAALILGLTMLLTFIATESILALRARRGISGLYGVN